MHSIHWQRCWQEGRSDNMLRRTAIGDCGRISGRNIKVVKHPLGRQRTLFSHANETGGFILFERYLEFVEWHGETVTDRFDVGLFTGPAEEKCPLSLLFGQSFQFVC